MVSMNAYADINDEITKTYDSVDLVITKTNVQNKSSVQKKASNKVTTDATMVFENMNNQTNTNNQTNLNNQPNPSGQTDSNNPTDATNQTTTDNLANSTASSAKYNFLEKVENSNIVVKLASQSKEELQSLYNRGFRVFEITVSLTRDGQLVLADNPARVVGVRGA